MLIWGMSKTSGNRLPHLVTEITWSKVITVKAEIQIKWQKNSYLYHDFKMIIWCLETEMLKSCNWNCPWWKNNAWKQQMQCSTVLYHIFLTMCTPGSLRDRNSWNQSCPAQGEKLEEIQTAEEFLWNKIPQRQGMAWGPSCQEMKDHFLVRDNRQWGRLAQKL